MKDLVSIIMPSYNTAQFIEASINSIIGQTYKEWELIIIDDCSSDNTKEILEKIDNPQIRVIFQESNKGAAYSRNIGLKNAKGKWIAFLDSDDIWNERKLEKQIGFMHDNGYHFSYTKYEEISCNGMSNGVIVSGPKYINRTCMYKYCWPGCLTVMYDRELIGDIQIDNIKKNNDYAMWLKVSKKTDCYLLDECLAYYRKGRQGSISSKSWLELIKWHYILFREAEHMNIMQSICYTLGNLVYGLYKKIKYVKRIESHSVIC